MTDTMRLEGIKAEPEESIKEPIPKPKPKADKQKMLELMGVIRTLIYNTSGHHRWDILHTHLNELETEIQKIQ